MAAVDEFNSWLSSKLRASKADVSVFGSYITGILEGDENNEEKVEALEGILGAIIVRLRFPDQSVLIACRGVVRRERVYPECVASGMGRSISCACQSDRVIRYKFSKTTNASAISVPCHPKCCWCCWRMSHCARIRKQIWNRSSTKSWTNGTFATAKSRPARRNPN